MKKKEQFLYEFEFTPVPYTFPETGQTVDIYKGVVHYGGDVQVWIEKRLCQIFDLPCEIRTLVRQHIKIDVPECYT